MRAARCAALWFGVALSAGAHAQGSALIESPGPIVFPAWREVSRPEGAVEYLVTFPSPFASGFEANNAVPLRVFVPEPTQGPIPFVLVLHYWGATDLRVERTLAAELNRQGIGAAVLTLPYHLERAPAGTRSGQLAIQPDAARLRDTMQQAVLDARRALDFMATRPEFRSKPTGLVGTSLGAIIAASLFGVEPRITHTAFLLGGVDLAGILWNSSRVVAQRETLRRRGYTESRLREELAPIEPSALMEARVEGPALVVGAQFDTVIPRRSTMALIDRLPSPEVLWLDTGHYGGIFVQRRLMREVGKFYRTEFNGTHYEAPDRLYAPTVRIGFGVESKRGLDLAVGIDLWRFDRQGDALATFLLTPRGPSLFIGQKISQGLHLGAFGNQRGLGVGLFWSTVL